MRLTCPNCGAEYDVPEGLIPPAGKHVQCTACHTRWFRRGEAREDLSEDEILRKLETRAARPGPRLVPPGGAEGVTPFVAAERMAPEAEDPEDDAEDWPEAAFAASRADEMTTEAADEKAEAVEDDAPAPAEDPRAGDASAPPPAPAAFPLTPDRQRGPEAPAAPSRPGGSLAPAPTKPATPSDDGGSAARETAPRVAAPTPTTASAPAASVEPEPAPRGAARVDPRIELREAPRHAPRIELSEGEPVTAPRRRPRRFLPGFLLALLLAGLAFEIYIWRAPLADQVPAAAPAIEGYAGAVDAAREWLGARFGRPSAEPPAP